jgi:O-antigen ligase
MTTIELCIYLGLYFVLVRLVQSKKTYRWIFWAFTISATALLLFFFAQGLNRGRLGLRDEYGLGPNRLALIVEVAFFFYIGYLFSSRNLHAFFYLLGGLFTGFGLILTFSRGAWISTIFGTTIFIFYVIRQIRLRRMLIFLFFSSLLLLVLVGIVLTQYDSQLLNNFGQIVGENMDRFSIAFYTRLTVYRNYFSGVMKFPFFGVGFSGDLKFPLETRAGKTVYVTRTAHNSYLYLLYLGGGFVLLGLLSFLFLHWRFLVHLRPILNRLDGYLGNTLLITYIVIIIHMMVESFVLSSVFWGILSLQGAALNLAANQDKLNLEVDNATIA